MTSHPNLDANGKKIVVYVLCVSAISALLQGYAQAMMNGINLLPAYISYFNLTTTSPLYALNVSVIYLGTLCSTPFATYLANHWGRKWGLRIAASLGVLGALLQTAAVHESMFMIARFVIGMAINTGYVVAPTYLSEVMHPAYRVLMVGFGASSWYLGSIVASFVTYGSQYIDSGASNWTWRLPSLLQLLPSILCFAFIHLVPESPRWLVYHDRAPEALAILVKYHGNGDSESPVVALEYEGIVEALRIERETQSLGWKEFLRTPQNRKRGIICAALGIMTYWSGNNIVAYYLGDILIAASITGVSTQLAVNIGLAFWGYVVAVFSSFLSNRMGRRPIFLGSNIGMAICMLIQGLLTKHYTTGKESFTPASSGAIVFITFVFNAAYNMALTPLGYVYPTEVCSYSLRANGLGLNSFVAQTAGFAAAYWTPYAMKKAWIYYLAVAVWDVLQAVFVWFVFVETKGLSLEEVEGLFVDVDVDEGGERGGGAGGDSAEVARMEEGEGEGKVGREEGSGHENGVVLS